MIHTLAIDEYMNLPKTIPVVDVRTPLEFNQGHICGAYNLPIFSNEERVQVGTCYKQRGREEAVLLGFDLTGPKWSGFIEQALELAPNKKIAIHCWRGGMRSGAMAWAFDMYGFEVYLLQGGYKKYRRWVLDAFAQPFYLLILGGMTGSGKTNVLRELKKQGEQVIDLEDLAQHQGSAYGSMGKLIQPTQEQFENNLASVLQKMDNRERLWLEDESITIGKRVIPNPLWIQMRAAEVIKLVVPIKERIQFLVDEYGSLDQDFLIACTQQISKRLGPEQTKSALLAIEENRMSDFIRWVLVYYDKTYQIGQNPRAAARVYEIKCEGTDASKNAVLILEKTRKINLESNLTE